MKTIRLIYPQWQGANITRWIPNIPEEDSSRGCYLCAMLLDYPAPHTKNDTYIVPVSTDISERVKKSCVPDHDVIAEQTKEATDTLRIANPDKVVTLGGECSVSVGIL